jgi:hypothetical protein
VIEETECRIAPLLDFCNHEAGANRVDRSRRHEHDVVRQHGLPHDEIRDRAVIDGLA